jgi:hypothetical protein
VLTLDRFCATATCAIVLACSSGGSSGGVVPDAGLDSASGGIGGGIGGAGGGIGGVGAGGAGGTAATGGAVGGAGGSGSSPHLNTCSNYEAACAENTECCVGDVPGGGCIFTGSGTSCYPKCTSNEQCVNECCENGLCAPAFLDPEGNMVTYCNFAGCKLPGAGCEQGECCAGELCIDVTGQGYGLCTSICVTDADCEGGCCQQTSGGSKVCAPLAFCP